MQKSAKLFLQGRRASQLFIATTLMFTLKQSFSAFCCWTVSCHDGKFPVKSLVKGLDFFLTQGIRQQYQSRRTYRPQLYKVSNYDLSAVSSS